jgi:hypothetical protein
MNGNSKSPIQATNPPQSISTAAAVNYVHSSFFHDLAALDQHCCWTKWMQ